MKYRRYRHLIPAVIFATVVALAMFNCATSPPAEENYTFEEEKGVIYSTVDGKNLRLDIAWPTSAKGPFPAIVFIHGGGWSMGDRFSVPSYPKLATGHGYVFVTVDYRLAEPNPDGGTNPVFPEAIEDVKCAVRWVRANAAKYNVDPDKIGAAGRSAGGHLSLMLGVTSTEDWLAGSREYSEYSNAVQAVVNFAGPMNLRVCYEAVSSAMTIYTERFLGGTPEEIPDVYELASPYTYLDGGDAPTLAVAGIKDTFVPFEDFVLYDARAQLVGAHHDVIFHEGGHDTPVEFIDTMYDFFDTYLKGE